LVARGAVLVGQSLGGLTGVEVVGQLPGIFGHLVLVDILPLPAESAKAVAEFLDGPSVFRTREQIVERSLAFGFGGSLDSLRRAVYLNTTELPGGEIAWRHHLGVLGGGALPSKDLEAGWDAIAGVTVPLDLIWARHGILGANSLARLSQVVPSARHVGLDAGHNIQEDAPRDLAATLARLTGRVVAA
jgi:pimeloyl-ACP methyl ester carboxylesterase